MYTFCQQVQVQTLTTGVLLLTFLAKPNGEVISQIAITAVDAMSLAQLLVPKVADDTKTN